MSQKPQHVKITIYIEEEEDWIVEGIVRERKRKDRGYSKAEYFRELMRRDPSFMEAQAAHKSDK